LMAAIDAISSPRYRIESWLVHNPGEAKRCRNSF
jgi:hypothetical protein